MGTRRPLIVQMVHDPSALEPRCRLQDEDSDEFGPVIPESSIAEAIRERTEVHLRKLGATVSSKVRSQRWRSCVSAVCMPGVHGAQCKRMCDGGTVSHPVLHVLPKKAGTRGTYQLSDSSVSRLYWAVKQAGHLSHSNTQNANAAVCRQL